MPVRFNRIIGVIAGCGLVNFTSWLVVMIFLFPVNAGMAQNDAKSRIDSLNKEAFAIFRTDPAKTRSMSRQSLSMAESVNYPYGAGKALNYIGMTFHMAGDYDSAAFYFNKSLEVFTLLNDSLYIGKVLNNLAFLSSDRDFFNLAIDYNLKSLQIAEKLNDTTGLLHSYNNIGIAYEDMEQYDRALEFFRKSIDLAGTDERWKEDYYNAAANIGLMHIYRKNYAEAKPYIQSSLNYFIAADDNYGIEQSYRDLGLIQMKLNQPDSALHAFELSKKYAKVLDDKKTLITIDFHLAELYFGLRKWNEAGNLLNGALQQANQNEYLTLARDCHFYLAKIDSITGEPARSLEHFRAGVLLNDRMRSQKVQNQIAELNIRYETDKKDQQISLLNQDKEIKDLKIRKQQAQRNFLVVILLVVTSFVVFFFVSRRRIREANIKLAVQNREIASKNTVLRQHEEQLGKMVDERTAELLRAKEKAEESERLKSAFLANMSHELRTPLNGILGFMELLQEEGLKKEDQESFFKIIRKSSDRLLNTINNIVDISKIESGQAYLNISELDIAAQIGSLYDFFLPEAMNKGIRLTLDPYPAGGPLMIRSDREKLDSIMTNLIKNAIKYTTRGSVGLSYRVEDNFLYFSVSDTGIGIGSDQLESVFNRFTQIQNNLNITSEGSGLGLAISRAYTDMLNGTIGVESEPSKGSVFRIKIPVNR